MRTALFAAACVLWASVVSAQTGALTAATVQFSQNGAILPTQVMTISLPSGALCGQSPKIPAPPIAYINTTGRIVWDDPADATKDCIATQGAGGTLLGLPTGPGYTATTTFTNDFNRTSPTPSAPSNPFTRGAPPSPLVPTGVRVVP